MRLLTHAFLLPRDAEGALLNVLGSVVFIGAFALAAGTAFVPVFLTLGGGFLLVRGSERNHRVVGLAALLSGLVLVVTMFLAIATTAI